MNDMNKSYLEYFEAEDVLYLSISDGPEEGSVELSPNITAELNGQGEMIGIEILHASEFVADKVLESAQAKLLHLRPNAK